MQSVIFPLPADEFELSGHPVQFAVPFVALYVPAGHIAHCPLDAPVSGPVYPVLHAQLVVEFALKGALFRAQQSSTVVVPTNALNPTGHAVHTSTPLTFENVSCAHVEQSVAASCA
jgi:hypothetical protein